MPCFGGDDGKGVREHVTQSWDDPVREEFKNQEEGKGVFEEQCGE